jgi:hypothetical protein
MHYTSLQGCAIAQAVSRRFLTVEAQFRVRVSPCAICGGQRGSGIGFSLSPLVSPVSIIPPFLYSFMQSYHRPLTPI